MRIAAATVLATLALSQSAFAGGPVIVAPDPVPVVAPAPAPAPFDWSGLYGGLSYGATSGDVQFIPGSYAELDSGSLVGVHLGYLFQNGAFVYGAELAYGGTSDTYWDGFEGIDTVIDLKAKAGFAANRALFYGVLGYSRATLLVDGGEWGMTGPAFGLGAEYAMTDRVSIGLEYLSRDLSGSESSGFPVDAEGALDTVSLRINFSF